MGVQMRERPMVTGENAKRFLERSQKNKLNLSRQIIENSIRLEKDEKQNLYRYIEHLNKGY